MIGAHVDRIPPDRLALLTTHFGDTAWVELLLQRLRKTFPALTDERIFVIDQNRTATSAEDLMRIGQIQILSYERSEPHFAMTGHDHAHVLNLAVREVVSDYLLIFDSDAHPVSTDLQPRLAQLLATHDAVLAALGQADERTHPCFMAFGPRVDRSQLWFDEGQLEVGIDTGRLVHDQLAAQGLQTALLRPTRAFGGRWGTLYLDGTVYHHGSGSFGTAADPRLQAQAASWRQEGEFFRRRVFAGRYELSPLEAPIARLLHVARIGAHRLILARIRGWLAQRAHAVGINP